jgi:O-antigen/teichoic acid export membrane protein
VNFHFSDIKINKQGANELFHFGKWMTLQNISGAIFNSLDKLLLGFYFNTTVVGLYNIVISVTQLPHFILASASSFLMSKITANTANFQILRQYYYKSLVASASLVIIMLLILATMYPYLASHFNLAKIKYEYFVMLISYGVLAMCVSPYNFALGLGRFKLLSVVNTISSLVGIILVVVLVNSHGIVGAVASRVFYTMIVSLVFFLPPILFKKTIDNIN